MTTTRKPPYLHADGSNCWTKHCSRRTKESNDRASFFKQVEKTPAAKLPTNLPPLSAFQKAHAEGRIEKSEHPNYPYVTYKYARTTQFASDWDDVTLASRGIIFNKETGEVVARPFAKFFNYNEPSVPTDKLHGRVSVTDKLDGSLGIGYVDEDGKFNIATSGSFISEQSKHATRIYQEKYEGKWNPNPNMTYMWEIIYPENRVVVNYGDEDDLHLIGAVNKRTGKSVPLGDIKEWKWKRAEEYKNISSLDSVLATPDRENREGFIVHYIDTDTRVKYKHEQYLNIHRVATGVTSKTIWRKMSLGEDMDSWKSGIPEEFTDFISERQNKIRANYDNEISKVVADHAKFKASMPASYERKDFAVTLKNSSVVPAENKPFIMNYEFNGKVATNEIQARKIWERIKPTDEDTFWNM